MTTNSESGFITPSTSSSMSVSDSMETSESVDQEQEDFESTSDCSTPVINLLDRLRHDAALKYLHAENAP